MRFIYILIFLFSLQVVAVSQNTPLTGRQLKTKLDSILVEGNLLYYYEKATWVAYDMAYSDPLIRSKFESYLTYQTGKSIKTIILGKNLEKCVAEYTFITDYDTPDFTQFEERPLSPYEKKLIYMRERIMNQLGKEEYDIQVPEGFSLNFILLPFEKKYKLYILTGTSQPNIIPFGNDYLFITDDYGNIEKWRKFHTELIPIEIGQNSRNITQIMHTHTSSNPLISATDICTFMLYGPLYDLEELIVISEDRDMLYDMDSNTILVKDKP
ncbi:hypothetical protein [Bacteroides sp. 51]|uniref:hypothetical protein n=1 Tax=Bacteroides sp. 51 TaxID=2302938 RepID=UPI0013D7F69C|nr:hypothetical protein [Bacteroides sp. 51]NDV82022.1 hypothetical protein [Bacteroides sp. 51]